MTADIATLSRALAPRYRIEHEIGRGGMAVVYRGEDLRHARPVAIKIVSEETAVAVGLERFRRETSLVARLQHPHIVPLLDSGEVDGRPFYVMPLIDGESLRDRLRREHQLPVDDVLAITRDVTSALEYAHGHGVIHRDIKPENILLTAAGALVADFGIAVMPVEGDAARLTATGLVVGTPAYMSPEQATADRAIDGRSDLYSLGCVVYEALAGHAPFSGSSARELIARHLTDPVPSLRSARPDLSPAIESEVMHALAKAPADRPKSATEMFKALTGASAKPAKVITWRRAGVGVLLSAVVLAVVYATQVGAGTAFAARDWLLVAAVDNRTSDSLLGDELGGALSVSLEQSRFANVFPRQVIATALRAMSLPDTARLTPPTARDVAQRLNGRAIVFPVIEPDSAGFAITLRVEATETQRPLAVERETALSHNDVIRVLGRLAERVRDRLGERLRSEPPPTPLEFATTPSLQALRAWSEGQRHFAAARYDAALVAYREALALDSNFARAHNSLAVTLYWKNNRTLGDHHFDRALSLTSRLTERERLSIAADAASWRGRADEAIRGYQRILERYPDDRRIRQTMAYALLRARQFPGAIAEYEALLKTDSSDFGLRINLASCLVMVDRYPEALMHYARGFAIRPSTPMDNPGLTHEYAQTFANAGFPDSARRLLAPLATGNAFQRATRARALALVDAKRGMADSALVQFQLAAALSTEAGNPTTLIRNRLYVARMLALMERSAEARRALAVVEPLLQPKSIEPFWVAIAAEVAALTGDRERTTRLAETVARRMDPGNASDRSDLGRARAEALLLAGDASGAVAAAEEALAAVHDSRELNVVARAYELVGRIAEARDKHAEASRVPLGAGESAFSTLPSLGEAARLSLLLGDTTAARQFGAAFLQRWPARQGGFALSHRVNALLTAITH